MHAAADAATVQMPPPRTTASPPTAVLPDNFPMAQRRRSRWPLYVAAIVLVLAMTTGGIVLAWTVWSNRSQTSTVKQSTPSKQDSKNQTWEAKNDSPSWKLVGTWRAEVVELGVPTTITYTFNSDGTSESTFTDGHGKPGTPSHASWSYSDGMLYETYADGSSGRCSIDWKDDDTFELTILDNGIPAYSGLKRLYKRVS